MYPLIVILYSVLALYNTPGSVAASGQSRVPPIR
jgi:hypothetical protein